MNAICPLFALTLWIPSPFPPGGDNIRVEKTAEEAGMPLPDLLDKVAEVSGRPVTWSPSVGAQMKGRRVPVNRTIDVPRERFLDLAQGLLRVHDLVMVSMGPEEAPIWVIDSLVAATLVRSVSRFVPHDRVKEFRSRWEMITTVVPLRRLEVGEAEQAIQRTQSLGAYGALLIPVPSARQVIVTDLGPMAARSVELLLAMDAAAPELPGEKAPSRDEDRRAGDRR